MQVNEAIVAVVALAVTFGMPMIIVGLVLSYRLRKTRLTHDTVLKLADKGVPIPPELISPVQREPSNSDLKTGLILLSVGAGLMLFFFDVGGPWGLAAIPVLMGLGYLVAWKVEKPKEDALRSGS